MDGTVHIAEFVLGLRPSISIEGYARHSYYLSSSVNATRLHICVAAAILGVFLSVGMLL